MEGFTERVALDLEASFAGAGPIVIVFITLILRSSSNMAAAVLSADQSFTLQSLRPGSCRGGMAQGESEDDTATGKGDKNGPPHGLLFCPRE